MADFQSALKQGAQVAGASLLGASGPSGRASATSLLNNRLRLAEAQRQSDLELSQIAEEKERKKLTQTVEFIKAGRENPEAWAKIQGAGDGERFLNMGRAALQGLGQPPDIVDLWGPEAPDADKGFTLSQGKQPTKASLAYSAAQGDESAREALMLLSPEERKGAGGIINARSLNPDAPDVWLVQKPDGGLTTLNTGAGGAVKTNWSEQENSDGTISVVRQVGNSQPEVVDLLRDPEGTPIKTGASARAAASQAGAAEGRANVQERHDTREGRLNAGLFLSKERLKQQISNQARTSEASLRDDFEGRVKPFREQLRQLDTLDSLLSGDVSALDEAQIVNQLATLSDSNVRAQANLNTFKNPGDLGQRLAGSISRFFAGNRTPSQLEEIRQLSAQLRSDIFDPAMAELSNAYKDVATRGNLTPENVVVGGSKSISSMSMEELEAEKQRLLNGGG